MYIIFATSDKTKHNNKQYTASLGAALVCLKGADHSNAKREGKGKENETK